MITLQHVWNPSEYLRCHLRLQTLSGAHYKVSFSSNSLLLYWSDIFFSLCLFDEMEFLILFLKDCPQPGELHRSSKTRSKCAS